MSNKNTQNPNSVQNKGNKKEIKKRLFKLLTKKPLSRRMSATLLGFTDQTYMVTDIINKWIKNGKAQVIGKIRCSRSNRMVEAITTNPELFESKNDNQLKFGF